MEAIRKLADIEKDAILHAIRQTGGVIEAARQLGIGKSQIYRKLRAYGYKGRRGHAIIDQVLPHVET